ncbi:MAG: hypothetical protein LUH43_03275 [Clostridia bacterium]|nr:hypothetical protein [Clostridia bacterium]
MADGNNYKICPVCGTYNTKECKTCECGYVYGRGDEGVTEKHLKSKARMKSLRKLLLGAIMTAILFFLFTLTARYGTIVLFYVVGISGGLAVLLLLASVVMGKISRRNERKNTGGSDSGVGKE